MTTARCIDLLPTYAVKEKETIFTLGADLGGAFEVEKYRVELPL